MPRCYAIAKPRPSTRPGDYDPYVAVGTWPTRGIRGQLHLRLARTMPGGARVSLRIGGKSYALTGGGGDAWARDRAMDAAIIAAMRSASSMIVTAIDTRGRRYSNTYDLSGAATAMDAATVGCANLG
ncbi:MAG: invasion associated locus B family protein [Allopontixanthobacter sediminis]